MINRAVVEDAAFIAKLKRNSDKTAALGSSSASAAAPITPGEKDSSSQ
jgi:hypothetical protein